MATQTRTMAAADPCAAREDALTGLNNRRMVDEMLPLVLDRARVQSSPFAVAILDLDHFKHINDRFGHGLGDQVLAPGLHVTVSIGLVAGGPEEPRERLIERADAALYEAKRAGRNRVHRA